MNDVLHLTETIQQIEADLELLIQQKNASIVYTALPTVEGSSVLLYQLFYNLINNALKFAKPIEPSIITITSSITNIQNNQYAEIKLADNGIGFDEENAAVIFNTFTRLHSKDQFEGTGLGLALCKKIVERHRGTITATGKKDVGACFTITLPLK